MSACLELFSIRLRCVSDHVAEAADVVRELEESNDSIDEVIEKVALKRNQSSRPKRTCAPSVKLVEQAALPSGSDTVVTECDDFDSM